MTTRREREERDLYAQLYAKYGTKPARRERRPKPADDDDSPILMFTGKRADSLIASMFGPAKPDDVEDQDDDDEEDDEEEDDDDDEEDDDEPEPDPTPQSERHRYFGGRRPRG